METLSENGIGMTIGSGVMTCLPKYRQHLSFSYPDLQDLDPNRDFPCSLSHLGPPLPCQPHPRPGPHRMLADMTHEHAKMVFVERRGSFVATAALRPNENT